MSDEHAACDSEQLPVAVLAEYLRARIEGASSGITVRQFPSGHSNLTYQISCADGHQYVLRRGPLGPVALKAHDMGREFRVLQAVHQHFHEAPRPFLLCEETSVIGGVFFVMEHRSGIILRNQVPPAFSEIPDHAARISEAFIDCMVRLHAVPVAHADLSALGKPEGFLARQVQGWTERWTRARTDSVPEMDLMAGWLLKSMPASPAPALVHNDYKLDNIVLSSVDTVEAVLDWEMATVGDPLVDLGLTLCYWSWLNKVEATGRTVGAITANPGWFSREQFIARYAERTGRDLSSLFYYEVLGIFKLAVILQQIYFRFRRGQTQDPRFANFDQQVKALAQLGVTVLERRG